MLDVFVCKTFSHIRLILRPLLLQSNHSCFEFVVYFDIFLILLIELLLVIYYKFVLDKDVFCSSVSTCQCFC